MLRILLVSREEVPNVSKLVVDHKSQHTHLGGTAVVQFNGTLLKLGLLIEGVPAKVNIIVTEVTWEFSSSDVLHDGNLQEANEGENLKGSGDGNCRRSSPAGADVGELGSSVVNVSWKADSGSSSEVSKHTKHADTSVLDLDVTKTVELFLVSTSDKTKRVEEAKRFLGTKFALETQGLGVLGGPLGRSHSSGGDDKGGKDGGLHC
jgi:hypothetical protein